MTVPNKGVALLRKGRLSLSGTAYFVTKATSERISPNEPASQGLLMREGVTEIIVGSLEMLHGNNDIVLLAYVIMPDHIHLLFQLGEKQSLSKIVQRFAGFTGRQISLKLARLGSIW